MKIKESDMCMYHQFLDRFAFSEIGTDYYELVVATEYDARWSANIYTNRRIFSSRKVNA